MEIKEGVARQRDKASKDIQHVTVVKDAKSNTLVRGEDIGPTEEVERDEELVNGENKTDRKTVRASENDEVNRIGT